MTDQLQDIKQRLLDIKTGEMTNLEWEMDVKFLLKLIEDKDTEISKLDLGLEKNRLEVEHLKDEISKTDMCLIHVKKELDLTRKGEEDRQQIIESMYEDIQMYKEIVRVAKGLKAYIARNRWQLPKMVESSPPVLEWVEQFDSLISKMEKKK